MTQLSQNILHQILVAISPTDSRNAELSLFCYPKTPCRTSNWSKRTQSSWVVVTHRLPLGHNRACSHPAYQNQGNITATAPKIGLVNQKTTGSSNFTSSFPIQKVDWRETTRFELWGLILWSTPISRRKEAGELNKRKSQAGHCWGSCRLHCFRIKQGGYKGGKHETSFVQSKMS